MTSRARGTFIAVEGIEGVGKSTNLARLVAALEVEGIDVEVTREPGGTQTAEAIRAILLEHGDEPMPASAEALLMFAARALHTENRIRPALERGRWVVSDRFVDASRAYQGGGRGLPMTTINHLADLALDGLEPDLVLLLDAPVDVGLERADKRGAKDRFEIEQRDFFERVRATYHELANESPDRFLVVDASGSLDEVAALVDEAAQTIINRFN